MEIYGAKICFVMIPVVYNGKNRMFIILDGKGLTTWRRDITLDPRSMNFCL